MLTTELTSTSSLNDELHQRRELCSPDRIDATDTLGRSLEYAALREASLSFEGDGGSDRSSLDNDTEDPQSLPLELVYRSAAAWSTIRRSLTVRTTRTTRSPTRTPHRWILRISHHLSAARKTPLESKLMKRHPTRRDPRLRRLTIRLTTGRRLIGHWSWRIGRRSSRQEGSYHDVRHHPRPLPRRVWLDPIPREMRHATAEMV
jgi:hypothetical protein